MGGYLILANRPFARELLTPKAQPVRSRLRPRFFQDVYAIIVGRKEASRFNWTLPTAEKIMPSISWRLMLLGVLIGAAKQADGQEAQIIGRAVSLEADIFLSFEQPDPDYEISGDMFGIRSRDVPDPPDCLTCPGLPAAVVDQTFDPFDPSPRDRMGLIRSDDFGPFFGVVDTANDVGERLNTAIWTFDVAGYTDLRISIDMAAMGDFEAGDIERGTRDAFAFDLSVDGGPYEFLFASSVDEDATLEYQMELPDPDLPLIALDDPLAMDGVVLNNLFQTLSADVLGTGNQLELRFRAIADGADEVFAFRNLRVEGMADGPSVPVLEGDYSGNGLVEQADLDLVLGNWGAAANDVPATWINDPPEGFVDQNDLDQVLGNWGQISGAPLAATNVPEPSAVMMALLFALLIATGSLIQHMQEHVVFRLLKDHLSPIAVIESVGISHMRHQHALSRHGTFSERQGARTVEPAF